VSTLASAELRPANPLSDLNEAERYEEFDRLQRNLPKVWEMMRLNADNESVVIIPSVTLDRIGQGSGSMTQAYEERFLFLLLLLREPRLHMIYVTSMPIAPAIVEYYLALLPGVIPSHARARLSLVSVGDSTPRALSEKLLERPRLLARIAAMIPDPAQCHLVPYNTTELERDVAISLGIPMFGADPRLAHLGSKTGCRRLFAEEGIRHPLGYEDLHSLDDVTEALIKMRAQRPTMSEVIVKLNEGVSGQGNALVDVRGLVEPGDPSEVAQVVDRLRQMQFERPDTPLDVYLAKLAERGGIVEERITGLEFRSPSVQLRVTPNGQVELLSTHDQVLGGPSGQSYLGCRFPASYSYAPAISAEARIIGERLAREGVVGRFALDFVSVLNRDGAWTSYAIELNLRKGGTTHPFLTLQFLTDGRYDGRTGLFLTADGREKHLVATDHLESPDLRALTVEDLFDIVARHRLHFDQARQVGVVFHMISCLTENGRVGLTAIGSTPAEADAIYRQAERTLLDEARVACTGR
jgi:PGM1 C-terminal domain